MTTPSGVKSNKRLCELMCRPHLVKPIDGEHSTKVTERIGGLIFSGTIPIVICDQVHDILEDRSLMDHECIRPPYDELWFESMVYNEFILGGHIQVCTLSDLNTKEKNGFVKFKEDLSPEEMPDDALILRVICYGKSLEEKWAKGPLGVAYALMRPNGSPLTNRIPFLVPVNESTGEPNESMLETAETSARTAILSFGLMSCHNVSVQMSPHRTTHNTTKSEARRDDRVSLPYHIVKIRGSKRYATIGSEHDADAMMPLHMVRGHSKLVAFGPGRTERRRIWVMNYMRGDPTVGEKTTPMYEMPRPKEAHGEDHG
jgi:hypothetical protein